MREFHVFFDMKIGEFFYMQNIANIYDTVIGEIKDGIEMIHTANLLFCDMKIITKYGYRLFIHPQIGEPFEITLGKCANTKREIKPETNILHLLLSGEFDTEDCKVVEEVF
ncbi:MAG: hypothetical protein IJH64_00830 [Oscillospiraceae bacterium]|nr:hypothetical protein [Oscillospiraceae bacterium]